MKGRLEWVDLILPDIDSSHQTVQKRLSTRDKLYVQRFIKNLILDYNLDYHFGGVSSLCRVNLYDDSGVIWTKYLKENFKEI